MSVADRVDVRRAGRALAGQSVLVAVVCLVVDALDFTLRGPGVGTPVHVLLLLGMVLLDAALASPARFSGWVAVGFAVFAIMLAVGQHGSHRVEVLGTGELIAAYRAGAWSPGRFGVAALGALGGGVAGAWLVLGAWSWFGVAIAVASNTLLPWLVGRYTAARRAYIDELRHQRENELRDAAAEVEKAVARERTSIARDLHDVISHHVSAIGVHAGAARMKLAAGGDIGDSLAAVESASRSAMVDLRTMLDLLHGNADHARQPGLDNLQELFETVHRSGMTTRLSVSGVPRPVPQSLDIALYRITQEMLTNALRHGDGDTVDIELSYQDASITLVTRNGVARRTFAGPWPGTGRGLAGIRTRATMFHGCVSHGPDADGRWETIVTMPTVEAS